MATLFWDASGLAKYYSEEVGTETAKAVYSHDAAFQMLTTPWGYVETFALLQRKRNGGRLPPAEFSLAVSALRNDLITLPLFRLLTVSDMDIFAGVTYIQKHNLNSTDAALLATLLRYAQVSGETCVLIAADSRFYRSALAESLPAINPELLPAADVPAFFASL